ncbi:hypothetical protein ACF0H5_009310 [Mactra antiquata]
MDLTRKSDITAFWLTQEYNSFLWFPYVDRQIYPIPVKCSCYNTAIPHGQMGHDSLYNKRSPRTTCSTFRVKRHGNLLVVKYHNKCDIHMLFMIHNVTTRITK